MNNPHIKSDSEADLGNEAESQSEHKATAIASTGKHILAEFWQCQCHPALLTSTQPLLNQLIKAVEQTGLTLVGSAVHEFANQPQLSNVESSQVSGVTLTLLLAESHLCLHTWGEYQTVTMDVYVCNVSQDNSQKAEALFAACLDTFKPKQYNVGSISRQHQLPNNLKT